MAGRILRIILGGDASGATDAADETEKAYGKLGKKLAAFGSDAAAVFTGTALLDGAKELGGKLSEAFAAALDLEVGRDKLAAQLGLTAEASENFGRAAGELYADAYGESLEQVNDALRYVQQNIGDGVGNAESALKDASAAALDLTAVFGEDLGPITRAVGTMIKTGLVKDATEGFDVLTVGFQNGANLAEDLLDTMSEYSTQFRAVGIDAKMALGLMGQGLKAGARDADTVADAIKEFAIKSKDGSKTSAEAFQAIGLNAEKMTKIFAKGGPEAEKGMKLVLERLKAMKDPTARVAAAVGLFGTKAEDLQDALFALDPTTAVASLGQVEGAAKRMGDTFADNAATRIEKFKRGLQQGVVNFLGEQVIPKLMELADRVAPVLGELKSKIDSAFEWFQKPENEEILRAVAAVVGVLLVAAFVQLGIAAWGAAAGVVAATWPILLLAAAVGGLVFLFLKAYENLEWFRDGVENVKAAAASFWQKTLVPMVDWLQERWVGDVWPKMLAVINAVKDAWPTLEAGFQKFYENALKPVLSYIAANSEAFKQLGIVVGVIAMVIAVVLVAAFAAGIGVLLIAASVIGVVVVAMGVLFVTVWKLIQVVWDVFNNVRDALGGVIDWFENVIQVGWDLARNVGSAIADAGRAVGGFVGAVWSMAWGIGEAISNAIGWFYGLPGRILGAIGDLGSTLLNAGRDLIAGFIRGITDKWHEVTRFLSNAARAIPDWIKGPLGISSPSKVMMQLGRFTVEGLAVGMEQATPLVSSASEDMVSAVVVAPRSASPLAPAVAALPAPRPAVVASPVAAGPQMVTVQVVLDRRVLAEAVADVTRQREGSLR